MTTLEQLTDEGALEGLTLPAGVRLSRIKGHASTRRFFRVAGAGRGAVLMVYGADAEPTEIERFVRARTFFVAAGIRVPALWARGARTLLVEDAGDRLLDGVAPERRPRLYRQASRILIKLQRFGARGAVPNPDMALDGERLLAELEHMEKHALQGCLQVSEGADTRRGHYRRLAACVASLPRAQCHRDFHARNLLIHRERVVVVDFQDVMSGPLLYDAASLLDDNYCDVTPRQRTTALRDLWPAIGRPLSPVAEARVPSRPLGLPPAARQAYALVTLQRSLKALGTFGYQVGVVGQADYARYAARTWRHAARALDGLGWDDMRNALAAFERFPA